MYIFCQTSFLKIIHDFCLIHRKLKYIAHLRTYEHTAWVLQMVQIVTLLTVMQAALTKYTALQNKDIDIEGSGYWRRQKGLEKTVKDK